MTSSSKSLVAEAAVRRIALLFVLFYSIACVAQAPRPAPHRWTQFVNVDGQPEPVPAEWVATPEGKFAHSIKIPNPVPKDSGYRRGMKSEQYFEHLCKTEAGEFIFKTVGNVEGFYFMRPPRRPTEWDLEDRFKLEAPEIERTFQLLRESSVERGKIFVSPPWANYTYVEEPIRGVGNAVSYVRISGYRHGVSTMKVEPVSELKSRYALTWRGVKRPSDRELAIAGSEWIVSDLKTNEVLALRRDYARTGFTRNSREGIYWLNASGCPNVLPRDNLSRRFSVFVSKSLIPASGDKK